nr:6-pyruvoyl-tetrahydropterin synthase-related protein [Ardenticatena sp.]
MPGWHRIQAYIARVPMWVWWTCVLVLPAMLGLAIPGIGKTHDGAFHAYRLLALREAIRDGVWYPRLFPEFAFGYGFPVLHYYAPLAYYVGLLPMLAGRGAALALDFSFALSLLCAALSMGWLTWRLWRQSTAAVLAALTYTYLPYHLADVYQRGALAEAWAFVWWPLLLGAVWEYRVGLLTFATAGLLLSHNLSVLLILPVVALWMLALVPREGKAVWRRWLTLVGAAAMGSGVAAFYWIPALFTMPWVRVGHEKGIVDPTDFLAPLSQLTQLEPKLFLEGIFYHPAQMLLLGGVSVVLVAFWPTVRHRLLVGLMTGVLLMTYLLQTPSSAPLWRMLVPLQWLQFPWRWMGIAVLSIAFLVGAVSTLGPKRIQGIVGILVVLLIAALVPTTFVERAPLDPDRYPQEMWQLDRTFHRIGATWTREFLPIWVDAAPETIYQSGPARERTAAPLRSVRLLDASAQQMRLALVAEDEATIALHQFYLPPWRATLDGSPLDTFPLGELGLVAARIPPGEHTLTLAWASTRTIRLAEWLSVSSLLACLVWGWRHQHRRIVLLLVVGGLAAGLVWSYHRRHAPPIMPINAAFVEQGWLLGWQPETLTPQAGRPFHLTLYWLNRGTLPTDENVFVHITPPNDGVPVAQYDGYPNSGFTPTTRWEAGEIIIAREVVELPASLPPGTYDVWVGMYDWRTLERWPVEGREDDRIYLGTIEVRAPSQK